MCKHRVCQTVAQADLEQLGLSCQEFVARITDIVRRNLASGRAGRVMAEATKRATAGRGLPIAGTDADSGLWAIGDHFEAYVDRVIACFLEEHHRVEGLAAQDQAAWTALFEQLANRATHMLLRMRMSAARAANEASDFAQKTCEIIFCHPFPYDVSFDAWATLILRNQILHRYTRSRDLVDREPQTLSLDQPGRSNAHGNFSLYDLLNGGTDAAAFESVEVQEWLLQAVARLRSRAQQQVIVDTFFYDLPDDEIARRLGKSRQAVHNLRHRALRHLRGILIK
jgi:RNA polymerase sigma factor (sigma-70 family)